MEVKSKIGIAEKTWEAAAKAMSSIIGDGAIIEKTTLELQDGVQKLHKRMKIVGVLATSDKVAPILADAMKQIQCHLQHMQQR